MGSGASELRPGQRKEIEAWLASVDIDCAADYLRRGRKYASLPADRLFEAWKKAFRAWVQFHTSEIMRRERDDLGAALELRGIPLPFADVADATEALVKMADNLMKELQADPERLRRVEDSLREDLKAFRGPVDLKN